MPQSELLNLVAHRLNEAGIPYMITGSIASSLYGEPRLTHDIDVVVELGGEDLDRLVALFPQERYFLDRDAVREAIRTSDMFNVIDLSEGDKVDFWLVTDSAFDRSRFARRVSMRVFDCDLFVATPEDMILMKLLWSRQAGGSRKQMDDARGIYEVQRSMIDEDYLSDWAKRLNMIPELEQIKG